jgi:hypothetical protein
MEFGGKRGSSAPSDVSTSLRFRQGRGVIGLSVSHSNFRKIRGVTSIALLAPSAVALGVPDVGVPTDDFLIRFAFFGAVHLPFPSGAAASASLVAYILYPHRGVLCHRSPNRLYRADLEIMSHFQG